jgi:hypothetical protein
MKILLDECIPVRLKTYLTDFEVKVVSDMDWSGLKNGKLMKVASEAGFDLLFTVDKSLQFQQNLKEYNLSIVVFDVQFNRLQDFVPLIPKFLELKLDLSKKIAYIIR